MFNPSIQNRGAGGVLESKGRQFPYPLTFTSPTEKIKGRYEELPRDVQMTGYYAFGANQLRIMNALDKILSYLEEKRDLKV